MNKDVETLLQALQETPRLLKELIIEINPELYKVKNVKGKWFIHGYATHVAVSDIYGF